MEEEIVDIKSERDKYRGNVHRLRTILAEYAAPLKTCSNCKWVDDDSETWGSCRECKGLLCRFCALGECDCDDCYRTKYMLTPRKKDYTPFCCKDPKCQECHNNPANTLKKCHRCGKLCCSLCNIKLPMCGNYFHCEPCAYLDDDVCQKCRCVVSCGHKYCPDCEPRKRRIKKRK